MEVMRRAGLSRKLAGALKPIFIKAFSRRGGQDVKTWRPSRQNVSANLLGLGNAATPYGISAAKLLSAKAVKGTASDELCMLVVINTASLQLIPATVAGLRASAGADAPFDILPAVWITSAAALIAGISAAKLFSRLGKRR
jgi:spore maturation protein A